MDSVGCSVSMGKPSRLRAALTDEEGRSHMMTANINTTCWWKSLELQQKSSKKAHGERTTIDLIERRTNYQTSLNHVII